MLYLHLFMLMDECQLSYEQLGDRLGISGMTLRRWRQNAPSEELPRVYQPAMVDAIYQLIIEGSLPPTSPVVQIMLQHNANLSIGAALKNLGLSSEALAHASPAATQDGGGQDRIVQALAMIGMDDDRKEQIEHSHGMLTYFQKLGQDWKSKIEALRQIIRSTKITSLDKLVAYGALFYLITPFDLIPDYVPVVGLIDDYGVLAIAVAYYVRKQARAESGLPAAATAAPLPI